MKCRPSRSCTGVTATNRVGAVDFGGAEPRLVKSLARNVPENPKIPITLFISPRIYKILDAWMTEICVYHENVLMVCFETNISISRYTNIKFLVFHFVPGRKFDAF